LWTCKPAVYYSIQYWRKCTGRTGWV